MKPKSYMCFAALILCIGFTAPTLSGGQSKSAPAAQVQESENTDYSEDEFIAYQAAKDESDFAKKSAMLLDFMKKYPKPTSLTPSIDFEYRQLLNDLSGKEKYELLESLSEEWLKSHPNDSGALTHIANATSHLKKFDRCAECLEELYKTQPSPTSAKNIFHVYQSSNNLAKQIEWSDKLFKMPEFEADYALRAGFLAKYLESKNIPKAAEYAQLTLKSADLVKQPTAEQRDELKKIRQVCYYVMGLNLFEKDKLPEAIEHFQKSIKTEPTSDAYFFLGRCVDNQATASKSQDKAEEAMNAYAKAELMGGDNASKANERIKQIYPALHGGSDIGINKVYRRAKEELGILESQSRAK